MSCIDCDCEISEEQYNNYDGLCVWCYTKRFEDEGSMKSKCCNAPVIVEASRNKVCYVCFKCANEIKTQIYKKGVQMNKILKNIKDKIRCVDKRKQTEACFDCADYTCRLNFYYDGKMMANIK